MHEVIDLNYNPTRFSTHRFTDAALPDNTWRISGIVERTQWMEMHLKRDSGFGQRIKDYEDKMKRVIPRSGDCEKYP